MNMMFDWVNTSGKIETQLVFSAAHNGKDVL